MRIAIDVSIQTTATPTGVERAQRSLLCALAALAPRDIAVLLAAPRPLDLGFAVPAAWRWIAAADRGATAGRFWRQRRLAPALVREGAALLHSPVAAFPLRARCPVVVTWHEVPWREAGSGLELKRRAWLALAVAKAARILAVSERTRERLVAAAPTAAARTSVLHHGIDDRFLDHGVTRSRAATLAALALPDRPYLLHVGAARPRKELAALVAAFARLPERRRAATLLLLAGATGAGAAALRRQAARLGCAREVAFPGYVADALLPDLLAHAEAFVQPSRFEGFGLPAFEALACGAPVVATTGSALDELAPDAALRVAPGDVAALAAALEQVLADDVLRARLRQCGRERVALLRWRPVAERLLAVWRAVAGGGA